MRRLRFTDAARESVSDIVEYITLATSGQVADRFAEALYDRCRTLASLPGVMGRDRSELRAGLRSVAVKNHVIFFRYEGDVFEIVEIVDGRRDLDSLFSQE